MKARRSRQRLEQGYLDVFAELLEHEASVQGEAGHVCPAFASARAWTVLSLELETNPHLRDGSLTREAAADAVRCVTWWLVATGEGILGGQGRAHADVYVPLGARLREAFLGDGEIPNVDECYERVLRLLGAVRASELAAAMREFGGPIGMWRPYLRSALDALVQAGGGGSDLRASCARHPGV